MKMTRREKLQEAYEDALFALLMEDVIEEEGQRTYLSFDQRVRARTLVTENHRFTVYDGADWGELYQRDADPHEQYNLWTDPAHNEIKRQLTESALRLMVSLTDTSPHPHSLA